MAVTTIVQPDGSYFKIETIKAAKRLGTVDVSDAEPVVIVPESGDRITCYFRNIGEDAIWVARSAEDLEDESTRWVLAMGEAVRDVDSTDNWVAICDTGATAKVQWMYVNQGDE